MAVLLAILHSVTSEQGTHSIVKEVWQEKLGAREMAQCLRVPAALPENTVSMPSKHLAAHSCL